MASLFFQDSEDWTTHLSRGSGQSPIVKTMAMPKPCSCRAWWTDFSPPRQSGRTWHRLEGPCFRLSTSSLEDSRARISALQALEQAWTAAEADLYLNSSASLASASLDSFSWKTHQLSLFGGLTDFSWNSMRWGMMRDGQLFQPQKWEPRISESESGFLPTPTASRYGRNKSLSPGAKIRISLEGMAAAGELPGHPKGLLNPEWTELAMGYPIGASEVSDWATQLFLKPREKRSKD